MSSASATGARFIFRQASRSSATRRVIFVSTKCWRRTPPGRSSSARGSERPPPCARLTLRSPKFTRLENAGRARRLRARRLYQRAGQGRARARARRGSTPRATDGARVAEGRRLPRGARALPTAGPCDAHLRDAGRTGALIVNCATPIAASRATSTSCARICGRTVRASPASQCSSSPSSCSSRSRSAAVRSKTPARSTARSSPSWKPSSSNTSRTRAPRWPTR